jgi:hypothetical protein
MHAITVRVSVTDRVRGERFLHEELVSRLSQTPRFVAGYWANTNENHGASMVIPESERRPAESPSRGSARRKTQTVDAMERGVVVHAANSLASPRRRPSREPAPRMWKGARRRRLARFVFGERLGLVDVVRVDPDYPSGRVERASTAAQRTVDMQASLLQGRAPHLVAALEHDYVGVVHSTSPAFHRGAKYRPSSPPVAEVDGRRRETGRAVRRCRPCLPRRPAAEPSPQASADEQASEAMRRATAARAASREPAAHAATPL